MLDMYVSNVLSLKRFHGAETGNTHECLLKLSIGRVRIQQILTILLSEIADMCPIIRIFPDTFCKLFQ